MSQKQSALRFVACFILCLVFSASLVVSAKAENFTPYNENSRYYGDYEAGNAYINDCISFRITRSGLTTNTIASAPSGRYAAWGYYGGYNLVVPSSSPNLLSAIYINYQSSSPRVPVHNETFSSPFSITSWTPLLLSNMFTPADHERTIFFNLLIDNKFSFTSTEPTTLNYYVGNTQSTLASAVEFLGSSNSSLTTDYKITLRFSAKIPADASQLRFSLPVTLTRSESTLQHYASGGKGTSVYNGGYSFSNFTMSTILNNSISTVLSPSSTNIPFLRLTYANNSDGSNNTANAYWQTVNVLGLSGNITGSNVSSISGSINESGLSTYDFSEPKLYNQAVCIYSGGAYILDTGLSPQESAFQGSTNDVSNTIDSVHSNEVQYQESAINQLNNIGIDTFQFGADFLSGFALVGTIFNGMWTRLGPITTFIKFVLILGVGLVLLGRLARTMSNRPRSKGGDDNG